MKFSRIGSCLMSVFLARSNLRKDCDLSSLKCKLCHFVICLCCSLSFTENFKLSPTSWQGEWIWQRKNLLSFQLGVYSWFISLCRPAFAIRFSRALIEAGMGNNKLTTSQARQGPPKWSIKLSVLTFSAPSMPACEKMLHWTKWPKSVSVARLGMRPSPQPGLCWPVVTWDCKSGQRPQHCAVHAWYAWASVGKGSRNHPFMACVWSRPALPWTLDLPWVGSWLRQHPRVPSDLGSSLILWLCMCLGETGCNTQNTR